MNNWANPVCQPSPPLIINRTPCNLAVAVDVPCIFSSSNPITGSICQCFVFCLHQLCESCYVWDVACSLFPVTPNAVPPIMVCVISTQETMQKFVICFQWGLLCWQMLEWRKWSVKVGAWVISCVATNSSTKIAVTMASMGSLIVRSSTSLATASSLSLWIVCFTIPHFSRLHLGGTVGQFLRRHRISLIWSWYLDIDKGWGGLLGFECLGQSLYLQLKLERLNLLDQKGCLLGHCLGGVVDWIWWWYQQGMWGCCH